MTLLSLEISLIFLSFVICAIGTRLAMTIAIQDIPNERSSHTTPVPRTGGIAISLCFFGFLVPIFTFTGFAFPSFFEMSVYAGLAALIWTVALFDDRHGLGVWPRLLVQISAALLFSVFVVHVESLNLTPWLVTDIGFIGYLLSICWIIFFMNCFNFMDGINGLAAGTGLIAAVVIAVLTDWNFPHLISLLLIGILAGFLVFNFPCGKVFMGDTGSQVLGFVFATLALMLPKESGGQIPFELMPLLFFSFIFDVVLTLIIRFRRGETLMTGHRDHLYQILIRANIRPAWVTLGYLSSTAIIGLLSWIVWSAGGTSWLWLLIGALLAHIGYAFLVYRFARHRGVFDT